MANGFFSELINPQAQSPVPEAPAQVPTAPQLTPEQHAEASQQWLGILNNPEIMSGLMQFGINLTQPSWDSGAAPVFRALGEGMQASGRAAAIQREEATAAAELADKRTRTGLLGRELGIRESGQQQEYAMGQEKIKADQANLEREYQLKKELAQLPPNQQEMLMKMIAETTNPQKAPPTLWSNPAALAQWQLEQAELAAKLFRQYGTGSGVAPVPTPGRVKIDAGGNRIPSEVPTQ